MNRCIHDSGDAERAIIGLLDENPSIAVLEFSFLNAAQKAKSWPNLENFISCHRIDSIKAEGNVSFWQAALATQPATIVNRRDGIRAVTSHHGPGDTRATFDRCDIIQNGIRNVTRKVGQSQSINLVSTVTLANSETAYLPLIDFRIKQSPENTETVASVCEGIKEQTGVGWRIVRSRTSYHAFPRTYVEFPKYTATLGWALLFDPIVDGRHIAHQLIDGVGALRVW